MESGRITELSEIQNLQSTSLDPQYEIPKPIEHVVQEYPQHIPLQRSKRVRNVPLRYGYHWEWQ